MSGRDSTPVNRGRKPLTPAEREARFWSRVRKGAPGDCWEWTAGRHRQGYGQFWTPGSGPEGRGQMLLAHRVAYAYTHGACPAELDVLHACDNTACCNPAHLRLGTHLDNMRDAVARGRHRSPTAGLPGESNAQAKLNAETVRSVRRQVAAGPRGTLARLARELGVSPATLSDAVRGRTWAHLEGESCE